MNRREFLRNSAVWGASIALGNVVSSCAQSPIQPAMMEGLLKDVKIIDAHAHPDQFYQLGPQRVDHTSTLGAMRAIGMVASSFAAVGDLGFLSRGSVPGNEYLNTQSQLKKAESMMKSGQIKWVLKASDVPHKIGSGDPPGAILSIEGGDPLEGNP